MPHLLPKTYNKLKERHFVERRERDSNPRYRFAVHTLSRRAS